MSETKINPKQEILLKYIGIPIKTNKYPGIDPIRIMKGLFIFAQEVKKDWLKPESLYEFAPYNYGPCSFEVYNDLRLLNALGYLLTHHVEDQRWDYYSLSKSGHKFTQEIKIDSRAENFLKNIKEFVIETPFSLLLKAIYKEYPGYAKNSVFKV